jgi:TolB-like protein/Tfp pilus assembly protein PilF
MAKQQVFRVLSSTYQRVIKIMDDNCHRFGPFELDVRQRVLLRDGRVVPLPPKVLSTLLVLVQSKGLVVEKDDFMDKVWPDEPVEEGNLAQHIFLLRKALNGNGDSCSYIETVPRRGYRFIGTVGGSNGLRVTSPTSPATILPQTQSDAIRTVQRLAVLPFINTSGDPRIDYLVEGITESIINSLSSLPQLLVMSRSTVFRYKGRALDAQAVGNELGVDAVLAGHVTVSGNHLLISVELVDVANGWQLWGENYDRESEAIFDVQDQIAKQISSALRLRLKGDEERRLTKRYTENSDAYRAYLKGRHFWSQCSRATMERSIDYFHRAIDLDPTYALAYAGLADSYFRLATVHMPPKEAYTKAKSALVKALEIDDLLAEAHAALGMVKLRCDWDWEGAREELTRALEIKPDYATAHQWYGTYLDATGQLEKGLERKKHALQLEPLSCSILISIGTSLWMMRRNAEAMSMAYEALELDRNFLTGHVLLNFVHDQNGNFQQSIVSMEKAHEIDDSPLVLAYLGRAYARAGVEDKAKAVIAELRALSERRYVSGYGVALILSALGEVDQAFEWLEKAYNDHDEMLYWLKSDVMLDHLRGDARFTRLVKTVFPSQPTNASVATC